MWEKELDVMIEAGRKAREIILNIYQKPFDIEIKKDNSPVTLADKEADKFISNYLKERFPSYSFLTEESIDDLHRLDNDYCFIVDPVDGTQDFCARNGEFATNIALSYKHEIVVGVVVIPCENKIYYAILLLFTFRRFNWLRFFFLCSFSCCFSNFLSTLFCFFCFCIYICCIFWIPFFTNFWFIP
mgnify:CR=1 FL=1